MGCNAALRLARIVDNTERVLAIELLNAAQALEFRRPLHTSPALEEFQSEFRQRVPFVENERVMYPLIADAVKFVQTVKLSEYAD